MIDMCMRMIGKPTKGSVYLDDDDNIDLNCESCSNNDSKEIHPRSNYK